MEQARLFLGPDGRLHLTAMAYDGFNPHFISIDGNVGNEWALVEKIAGWGGAAGIHELTPVGPAGLGPSGWLGPPGVSGVVEYFIQFAGSPRYHIELLKVAWQNRTTPPPPPPVSFTVVGAGSSEFNGIYRQRPGGGEAYDQVANSSLALYTENGMWRLAAMGHRLMYVHAWPRPQPPLTGWSVARHCNASAGIRPPSCTTSGAPTGGLSPAPHLREGRGELTLCPVILIVYGCSCRTATELRVAPA